MEMRYIDKPVTIVEVAEMAKNQFGEMIKAVVDVQQNVMVLGGDLHADEEQQLLERGSLQSDLWGVNLYPAKFGTESFVEFDSMINIRPSHNNRTRGVQDEATRTHIRRVVDSLVNE